MIQDMMNPMKNTDGFEKSSINSGNVTGNILEYVK